MNDSTETKEKKDDKTTKSPRRNKKRRRSRRGGRRSEFEQNVIDVRRVTRVVAGGRRFSFSVAAVVGDKKGRVGVGTGKANDISQAIGKAMNRAKKNVITVNLDENNSIPHQLHAKYKASEVEMYPAPGRGIVAGSSVRDVIELAGIKDISAKLLSRSKNKLNNARAAVKALQKLDKTNI